MGSRSFPHLKWCKSEILIDSIYSPDHAIGTRKGAKKYRFAVECKWARSSREAGLSGLQMWTCIDFQDHHNIPVCVATPKDTSPGQPEKLLITDGIRFLTNFDNGCCSTLHVQLQHPKINN